MATRFDDDAQLARALAAGAGDALLTARDSGLLIGRELGALGDAMSQAFLSRCLEAHRPEDAVLSEEARDDPSRRLASRVWIIDPLDGTREYGEGREDWAVHVALAVDGVPTASAVALPGLGKVITTADPPPLPEIEPGPLRIAVSRTRPPAVASVLAERLDAELMPMGSAGFKAMAVLRGTVHAYVHAEGQYEWDSAAPVGVALAAGLHASRLDGSPLEYNAPDPTLPDLVICRPEWTEQLMSVLETVNRNGEPCGH